MKEVIDIVPVFTVEMAHVYFLARASTVYSFIYANLEAIKFSM